ncbi:MAG: DUF1761 domain-containing protein [Candidatus Micrarchaeota archaeon]|nr:DUF1761 domain-containing protein [Candidatus Micrarchaeota archaeon]
MVNYIAMLGAAIASMIIGFLWYGPLFGKIWMDLSGFKKEDMGKMKTSAQTGYVVQFIASIVMAFVLAILIPETRGIILESSRFWNALGIAFIGWLGFIATTTLGSVLWEGKPVKLYLLNNAYHLVSLLVMAAILVSFP